MAESVAQFVLLRHDVHGDVHWDLMLEHGEPRLATWRLDAEPLGLTPGDRIPAERLPDHRRAYLDYEGPVSGDRGHVDRLDRGSVHDLQCSGAAWSFRLDGQVIAGAFRLVSADREGKWFLQRA